MFVKNTSKYDTDRIQELLHFAARGVVDKEVQVNLRHTSKGWRARAYSGIPDIANVHPKAKYLITIKLDNNVPDISWSRVKGIKKLYPDGMPFDSWADCFVWLAAHEFRHIWQYQRAKRNGKRGKGEYDAEKFAYKRLNEWREHTGRDVVEPVKQADPFNGKRVSQEELQNKRKLSLMSPRERVEFHLQDRSYVRGELDNLYYYTVNALPIPKLNKSEIEIILKLEYYELQELVMRLGYLKNTGVIKKTDIIKDVYLFLMNEQDLDVVINWIRFCRMKEVLEFSMPDYVQLLQDKRIIV